MYGPTGKHYIFGAFFLIVVGCAVGVGCQKAYTYVTKHLEVRWQP